MIIIFWSSMGGQLFALCFNPVLIVTVSELFEIRKMKPALIKHDSSTKQMVPEPQWSNPKVVMPISKQAPQKQQNRKQLKIDETGTSVFPCSRMNVRLKITNECNYNNIL